MPIIGSLASGGGFGRKRAVSGKPLFYTEMVLNTAYSFSQSVSQGSTTGSTGFDTFVRNNVVNISSTYLTNPYNGILRWKPPQDAYYRIRVVGAGQSGCEGADLEQEIYLLASQQFYIIPGVQGGDTNQGSGGSWFIHDVSSDIANAQPLIIAGGGGSTYSGGAATHTRGRLHLNPSTPSPPNGNNGVISATTGFGGYGYHGAPGGGFFGAGNWGSSSQGNRAGNGFRAFPWGNQQVLSGGYDQGNGGFGGGGGYHSGANAGGGGGGYTGGAGGNGYSGNGSGAGSFLTTSFNTFTARNLKTHDGTFNGSGSYGGLSISSSGSLRNGAGFISITRLAA